MQRAKYFCTGMLDIAKYHHYALNLPLYTHFTSPIRRYADVMVHRQLEAVLLGSELLSPPSPLPVPRLTINSHFSLQPTTPSSRSTRKPCPRWRRRAT